MTRCRSAVISYFPTFRSFRSKDDDDDEVSLLHVRSFATTDRPLLADRGVGLQLAVALANRRWRGRRDHPAEPRDLRKAETVPLDAQRPGTSAIWTQSELCLIKEWHLCIQPATYVVG